MRLQQKVAIVTGAGTGIGEAIARKFAREGALWLVDGAVPPAKGSPGLSVPDALRSPPAGVLPLHHSHDGLKHKTVHRAG
jgi:NAD(P)-dependent dehydrogenase (short-subunit alcohol dehydrogenase family)